MKFETLNRIILRSLIFIGILQSISCRNRYDLPDEIMGSWVINEISHAPIDYYNVNKWPSHSPPKIKVDKITPSSLEYHTITIEKQKIKLYYAGGQKLKEYVIVNSGFGNNSTWGGYEYYYSGSLKLKTGTFSRIIITITASKSTSSYPVVHFGSGIIKENEKFFNLYDGETNEIKFYDYKRY